MLNRRNEEEVREWSAEVLRISRSLLEGKIGVIVASRALASLGSELGGMDTDFVPFVGIASETDHLPVGDERRHWAEDALRRKDAEMAQAEAFYQSAAISGCEQLVSRYGKDV